MKFLLHLFKRNLYPLGIKVNSIEDLKCLNPNVAKVEGAVAPGVKGAAVIFYCKPFTTVKMRWLWLSHRVDRTYLAKREA